MSMYDHLYESRPVMFLVQGLYQIVGPLNQITGKFVWVPQEI